MHSQPCWTTQPKHPSLLPLSHCSLLLGSKTLFPQTGVATGFLEHLEGSPEQVKPFSTRQVEPQPSPATLLPSSQGSATSITPFPQIGLARKQTEGESPLQMKPVSTLQLAEHPRPFLLSHSSLASTMPLPQKPQTDGEPKFDVHLYPASILQLEIQPNLLPLSHSYPCSTIPSPQMGSFLQMELLPRLPTHSYPGAIKQLLQPGLFPLSHCSPYSTIPFPQIGLGFGMGL